MTVRIATWNLEHPVEGWARSAILERIAATDADVWILTETHDAVEPTGGDYMSTSSELRPGAGAGERWVTIWSRLPVTQQHATSDPIRTAAATVALPDGTSLLVYGTVLPWCGDPWNGHPSKGAVAYKAALAEQAGDWRHLQQEFPEAALCVAGDFNQDLSDRHYYWSSEARAALRRQLADAGLNASTGGESDPVALASNGQKRCIDRICLSKSWGINVRSEAWSPRLGDRDVSDHYGIAITIG